MFLLASGKSTKSNELKVAILLNFLGDKSLHMYNTCEQDEGECLLNWIQFFKKLTFTKNCY